MYKDYTMPIEDIYKAWKISKPTFYRFLKLELCKIITLIIGNIILETQGILQSLTLITKYYNGYQ